jgi:hypothetical protein
MKGLRPTALMATTIWFCLIAVLVSPELAFARPGLLDPPSTRLATVALTAEAGFNGYSKPGSWIPVRITFSSNEAVDGEIVLSPQPDRSRLYGAAITLARNTTKQLTLYSPPTTNPIEALFVSAGKIIAATTPPLHMLTEEDRIVLVVSEPADGLNFLNDIHTPFGGMSYVAQLRPEDIPDQTAGLDTADVLVLNNIDTSALTEGQRTAIRVWVLGGGHMILSGGPGARLTIAGFEDFAPARVGNTLENSSVDNLKQLLAPNTVDATSTLSPSAAITTSRTVSTSLVAPVVILVPATSDARSLISSKDTPLIMRREIGQGIVDQLAFDPTLAPLSDWADRRQVYAGLMGGKFGLTNMVGPLRVDTSAMIAARALPGAALPPFLVIAGYLLMYVLAIGPINFFILRKLNHLAWAWITVPATVLLFALVGYATGFRLRGNEPEVHRLSIISGDSQVNDARAESIVGVFSPRRTTLDVNTAHSLAQEIQPNPNLQDKLSFQLSEPNRLQKIVATNNDVRSFYLQGQSQLPHIVANLDFIPGRTISEPARISGEIANESSAVLVDCVLIVGKDYHAIGNMAPNAHVQTDVNLVLNKPQMAMIIPPGQVIPTGYVSSFGTTTGRSSRFSAAPTYSRSPFDMDGASLSEILLNWRDFTADHLQEEAERSLLTSIYNNPDASIGNGANLACWENLDRVGAQVAGALYTDRGLRIWHLQVRSFLTGKGTILPPDAFTWSVLSSSSSVALDQSGLTMQPGAHIFGFTPWLSIRNTGNVDVSLEIDANTNSSVAALHGTSFSLYDWSTQSFTSVITSVVSSQTQIEVSGSFLSPSGEMRVRADVTQDEFNLTNIQSVIRIP